MFNSLSTSPQVKQQNSHDKISIMTTINSVNPLDSKAAVSKRKPTKSKRIIIQEVEENQKQQQPQSFSKVTLEKQSDEKDIQNETDTTTAHVIEE